MFTVKFKLSSRCTEAAVNLRKLADAALAKNMDEAKAQCVALTPRSDDDEPGHVHTQDTVRVEKVEDARYRLVAGGAMVFIELGSMYRAPLAPMRTSIEAMIPQLQNDLRAMKVL